VVSCPASSSPSVAIFLRRSRSTPTDLHSFPTRRSSDLIGQTTHLVGVPQLGVAEHAHHVFRQVGRQHRQHPARLPIRLARLHDQIGRHTSELQSHLNLVCRLLLERKKHRRQAPVQRLVH